MLFVFFWFFLSWILFIYASINIICLALNLGNCIIEMPLTILFALFPLDVSIDFYQGWFKWLPLVLDIRPKGPFYLVLTTDAGRPVSPFTLTQVSSEKNCNASVSMQAFLLLSAKNISNQINIQADKVTGHRSCLTKSFPWWVLVQGNYFQLQNFVFFFSFWPASTLILSYGDCVTITILSWHIWGLI